MIRRLPFVLAFFITGITIWHAYTSFTPGDDGVSARMIIGVALALAGTVLSAYLAKDGAMPQGAIRELAGVGILVMCLGMIIWYVQAGLMAAKIPGWEFVILSLSLLTFFLHSQRSFLIVLGTDSMLFFVALLVEPSVVAAVLFFATMLFLLAFLFTREQLEEVGVSTGSHPIRTAMIGSGIFLILFGVFFVGGPADSADKAADPLSILRFPKLLKGDHEPGPLDILLARSMEEDPFSEVRETQIGMRPEMADDLLLSFDRDLKFGDLPDKRRKENIVMFVHCRNSKGVTIEPQNLPAYWQMGALSVYDNGVWKPAEGPSRIISDADDGKRDGVVTLSDRPAEIEQRVIMLPTRNRALFLGYPVAAVSLADVKVDSEGMVSRSMLYDGRIKFSARIRDRVATPAALRESRLGQPGARYLEVPAALAASPEFRAIVDLITSKTRDPYMRIQLVRQELQRFKYTHAPGLATKRDPTLEFLRLKRGYCQHFASALALILRQMEIPTRIAIGFTQGEWDDIQEIFKVKSKHAHAWVEVHFQDIGWVPFDATTVPLALFLGSRPESKATDEPPDELPPDEKPPDEKPVKPPDEKPVKPPDEKPVKPPDETEPDKKSPVEPIKPPDRKPFNPDMPETPDKGPSVEEMVRMGPFDQMWNFLKNRPLEEGEEPSAVVESEKDADGGLSGRVASAVGRVALNILIVIVVGIAILFGIRLWMKLRKKDPSELVAGMSVRSGEEAVRESARVARERLKRGVGGEMMEVYGSFLDRMKRMGHPRSPAVTPYEFSEDLPGRLPLMPEEIVPFTDLFVRFRYGGVVEESDVKQARDLMQRIFAGLKR